MLWLALLLSCDRSEDSAAGLETDLRCDPLVEEHCLLPFPSSFFLEEDPATSTGWRVSLHEDSLPVNIDGVGMDPRWWNEKDGFATSSALYALFPELDADCLSGLDAIGDSLLEDAKSIILHAETGERVPHFAELEVLADDPARRLLILRPALPLEHGAHYVVGLRGLVDPAGEPVDTPEGFRLLRDEESSSSGALELQRERFESLVLPALEEQGWERSELQLAWDFVTVSEESSLGRIDWMVEDARSRLLEGGPEYELSSVEEGDCSQEPIGRTLQGSFQAPLYLEHWEPGGVLSRDASGQPSFQGEVSVPFTVRVPCTLLEDPRPGALVQFGHGVLGSQDEVRSGWLGELADEAGWVLFAVDWTGMKEDDTFTITNNLILAPSDLVTVPERSMQGFIEAMSAGILMRTGMLREPQLMVGEQSLIDPSEIFFHGVSQGSILGGGYATLNPDIRRAALLVGGMNFGSLLSRSWNFGPFLQVLEVMYDDWADISLYMALLQQLWETGETAGWGARLQGETDYLVQLAIGDESVPPMAGHLMARAAGAALLSPEAREVWGLEAREGPLTGSVLVEFDYGVEDPLEARPSEADVHEEPPQSRPGQEQVMLWFAEGLVESFCDGPCDPD